MSEDRSTIEQGDILVTDERAKQMNAPRDAKGRPILASERQTGSEGDRRRGPPLLPRAEEPASDAPKPPIRTVGPQLGPVR